MAYMRLQEAGFTPNILIGHGFGEIAASVAAGAFAMSEGADIAAARGRVLAQGAPAGYGMAVIQASRRQARLLLNVLRTEGLALAAENSSHESVVVGPQSALGAAADLAASLSIPFVPLKNSRPPHHPLLNDPRPEFKSKLRHVIQRPLHIPLFSPLRGRLYRDTDDLLDCLAEQLHEPIRFADAVTSLVRCGVTTIVECGPLRGLGSALDCAAITDTDLWCKLVRHPTEPQATGAVPDATVVGVA